MDRRAWMSHQLLRAARAFNAVITGSPTWGVRDRTVGQRVFTSDGERWLRLIAVPHGDATGVLWEGPITAGTIEGVRKADVHGRRQWADEQTGQTVRAELMTYIPGQVCSSTETLRDGLDLPASWWVRLHDSLDSLARVSTDRMPRTQAQIARALRHWFGGQVNTAVHRWVTQHGDLRWTNLTRTGPYLLDWEFWGLAPAGADAATLYCTSLLVPEVAQQVYEVFSDVLDTADGRISQLCVIVQLLRHPDCGELAGPLRRLADSLLTDRVRA